MAEAEEYREDFFETSQVAFGHDSPQNQMFGDTWAEQDSIDLDLLDDYTLYYIVVCCYVSCFVVQGYVTCFCLNWYVL